MRTPNRPSPSRSARLSRDRDVAHVADYGIDLVTAKGATGITQAMYGNSGYGLQLSRSPYPAAYLGRVLLRRREQP